MSVMVCSPFHLRSAGMVNELLEFICFCGFLDVLWHARESKVRALYKVQAEDAVRQGPEITCSCLRRRTQSQTGAYYTAVRTLTCASTRLLHRVLRQRQNSSLSSPTDLEYQVPWSARYRPFR